jgi:hypothetical protein
MKPVACSSTSEIGGLKIDPGKSGKQENSAGKILIEFDQELTRALIKSLMEFINAG